MAVRTATAQALDATITSLLSALDDYLALSGQDGEPSNYPADIFWRVLISQLMARDRMRRVIVEPKRSLRAYSVEPPPTGTNSVENLDAKA